jgi:hypothetical protein
MPDRFQFETNDRELCSKLAKRNGAEIFDFCVFAKLTIDDFYC